MSETVIPAAGQWTKLADVKGNLFFDMGKHIHHNVKILSNNAVELGKVGIWEYQLTLVISGDGYLAVGISFDSSNPTVTNGYGNGQDEVIAHAFGIFDVESPSEQYSLYIQHRLKPSGENLNLTVTSGHLTVRYIGTKLK